MSSRLPTQPHPRRPAPRSRDPTPHRRPINRSHSRDPRHRPSTWQFSCGLCQDDHAIRMCPRFLQLTPYQRYETVERRGYCRNCLARSHLAPDCPSLTACRQCDYRHHSLLHGAPQLEDSLGRVNYAEPIFKRCTVFIPTAMVRLMEPHTSTWKVLRALLCQSEATTKIAASTVTRFNLPIHYRQHYKMTRIGLTSWRDSNPCTIRVEACVTNELPRRPYADPIIDDPTQEFQRHELADMDPRGNDPIDIELVGDVYTVLRGNGVRDTTVGIVQAFQTQWGYVFAGPVRAAFQRDSS